MIERDVMEAKKGKSKKMGLGRGLSALISSSAVPVTPSQESAAPEPSTQEQNTSPSTEKREEKNVHMGVVSTQASSSGLSERIRYLDISSIINNPDQPRKHFDETEIEDLSRSIKNNGVLQPVLVRPSKKHSGKYEIIAGERRWRAATKISLPQLPVIIRDISDREALEIAIIENVQRSNLSPLEEAEAYQSLIDQFSLSQKEVAERVGKDRASVANFLRLLKLPKEIKELMEKGLITMGHAKAILTVKEPSAQLSLARKVVKESLSVRALEAIVSRVVVLKNNKKSKKASSNPTAFPDVIDKMRRSLGTKVSIKHHQSGRGKIQLEYFSESELDRLVEKLCG